MNNSIQNQNIEAALHYHEITKHSEQSLRMDPHFLDWENQPLPFKIYRGIESVPLSEDPKILNYSTDNVLDIISQVSNDHIDEKIPDLDTLSNVLYLTAGITKRKHHASGEVYFRAYSNTGALYHIDLYLVTQDLPDLSAGVYHFGPHDFALHRLRSGDYRALLVDASGDYTRISHAPVILISVSTYWRNAWKYQARAYRHCFWDSGTLHANLLEIAAVNALQADIVVGFSDPLVEALLGLDIGREGALTLVPLGYCKILPPDAPSLVELKLKTEPLSRTEVDYPPIRIMHAASSLTNCDEVVNWRDNLYERDKMIENKSLHPLHLKTNTELPQESLASVICRRGSTRAFDRARSISFEELSTALDWATRDIPFDFLQPPTTTLIDLYVIVNAVDDLTPGSYYYRRLDQALELLVEGNFRNAAGRLDLGQQLSADAAVNIYCMCSLEPILSYYGNRGYRAAQLEGGIIGGRLYLAAYAQRLGATGLTFFDDEVTDFFSPHAAGKSVLFLTALGYPDISRISR